MAEILLNCPQVDLTTDNSATEVDMKMNKIREVMKENEELKAKIKTKETELSQLKSTSEKDIAVITEELDSLDTELKVSVDTKIKAEQEIRRLQIATHFFE